MAFVKFVPKSGNTTPTMARIRPSGLISFDGISVSTFELNQASHAILFFDSAKKLLGILPTSDEAEEGAYELFQRRKTVSLKAPEFFFEHGLLLEKPMLFAVTKKLDGMLVLDLDRVPRRRGRRPHQS